MENLTYPWVRLILGKLPRAARSLPQALLLSGPAGLGKRTTALFLAQALLCETDRSELAPCEICASCRLYQVGNHPDLRILEVGQEGEAVIPGAAEEEPVPTKKVSRQISVHQVRALSDFLTITSHRGGARVVCIVPSEAMHPGAANALLKVLEEPPGATYFLLVSHQPERLLATILSRCFRLDFAVPQRQIAIDWLTGEGIDRADLALAQGGYAPLAGSQLATDLPFWNQRQSLLDILADADFDPLRAAEYAEDIDGPVLSRLLAQWAYDLVRLKSGLGLRYHLDYAASLEKIASARCTWDLLAWYEQVIQYGITSQHPLNKRLAMESLFSGYFSR